MPNGEQYGHTEYPAVPKLAFVDLETTGLDDSSGVWQIAMKLVDGGETSSKVYECAPFAGDVLQTKAVEMSGYTEEELRGLPDPRLVHRQIKGDLGRFVNPRDPTDKFWFIAYNAKFDFDFLVRWFKACGDRYFFSWFWVPPLCMMVECGFDVMMDGDRARMKNFQLATVARRYKIEVKEEALHDAMYDVELLEQLFLKLWGPNWPPQHGEALRRAVAEKEDEKPFDPFEGEDKPRREPEDE